MWDNGEDWKLVLMMFIVWDKGFFEGFFMMVLGCDKIMDGFLWEGVWSGLML